MARREDPWVADLETMLAHHAALECLLDSIVETLTAYAETGTPLTDEPLGYLWRDAQRVRTEAEMLGEYLRYHRAKDTIVATRHPRPQSRSRRRHTPPTLSFNRRRLA
jgi:hypothetical protein